MRWLDERDVRWSELLRTALLASGVRLPVEPEDVLTEEDCRADVEAIERDYRQRTDAEKRQLLQARAMMRVAARYYARTGENPAFLAELRRALE